MSIPGGNPYPHVPPGQPQPSPGNPYAQQPGQPQPVPQPAQGAAPYGYPQGPQTSQTPQPGGYGPLNPAQPVPPQGGGGRKGVPPWLWAAGGVVVASAVWGAVLVSTGGDDAGQEQRQQPAEERPDLAGYEFTAQMCDRADHEAFDADYEPDGNMEPSATSSEDDALDRSSCTLHLAPVGDDSYSWLYLTYEAIWHKGGDPKAEFAAGYESQSQYRELNYSYAVEPVQGLGDEAFIVYTTATEDDRLARVTLGVRDGWFEYRLTWEGYIDTATSSSLSHLAEEQYVTDSMRQSTEATLAALRGESTFEGEEEEEEYLGDTPPEA